MVLEFGPGSFSGPKNKNNGIVLRDNKKKNGGNSHIADPVDMFLPF